MAAGKALGTRELVRIGERLEDYLAVHPPHLALTVQTPPSPKVIILKAILVQEISHLGAPTK